MDGQPLRWGQQYGAGAGSCHTRDHGWKKAPLPSPRDFTFILVFGDSLLCSHHPRRGKKHGWKF